MRKLLVFSAVTFCVFPTPLHAQGDDHADVVKTIQTLFDGMAAGDTSLMWSVVDRDARLVQTFTRDGEPATRSVPMGRFMASVAGNEGPPFIERFWAPDVRIEDNLATVWISYTFYRGEQMSHCGEDSFQLARTDTGWKIIALADTQRREGCSDPLGR